MLDIGEVVQLKSGGPWMTVAKKETDGGTVTCLWFLDQTGSQHGEIDLLSDMLKRPDADDIAKSCYIDACVERDMADARLKDVEAELAALKKAALNVCNVRDPHDSPFPSHLETLKKLCAKDSV